jgi:2-phospho-L-lactate/phosphoenolpyruvate guanylyltransferase
MDGALLPVKSPARAKSRLAGRFSDAVRADLAWALFEDALTLCASAPFLEWWVVSDDAEVLRRARAGGLETLGDAGSGLNNAVRLGVAHIRARGAESVTIVPADVPLADSGDLIDLLDTGATSDLVVVPSRSDGGTNGLFLSPPDVIAPRFGPGSLRAHVELAEKRGLRCSILSLPRLELDIDTVEDIDAFLAARRPFATRTSALLERLA